MRWRKRDKIKMVRDVAYGAKLNLQDGFHETEIEG